VDDHTGVRNGKWKHITGINYVFEGLYDLSPDHGKTNNLASNLPHILIPDIKKFVLGARHNKREFFKNDSKKLTS